MASAVHQEAAEGSPPPGCPVDHGPADHYGYQPFDLTSPFASYARLRAEAPVYYDDRIGYWVVSRHDDVKAIFEDWQSYSSENAQRPVRPLAGLGGHVQVVAYDATKLAIELMDKGVVSLVLAQKPFDMGYLAVMFAQADAAGVTSLPRRVETGFAIIDKDNVKDPAIARFIYQVPGK